MLLGGRTAEELIFLDPTTGASNDIEKATEIAKRMVMEYGMSDELGPLQYGKPEGEVFLGRDYNKPSDLSNEVAAAIDAEVRKMIEQAHDEAREIISTHIDSLHRLADVLLDKETVGAEELEGILHDVPKWEHTESGGLRIRVPSNGAVREAGLVASQRTDDPAPNKP